MHDTAFRIGCLAIDTYSNPLNSRILEIGAYDVNGSLRSHVGPGVDYVGLDFEPGPGVNIVVKPGQGLPVDDDYFDLVVASSVLEHDSTFWNTFLEMCQKLRNGGYIYINVPSNGAVHRYPQDCWRFYPDSGRALAAWAKSQGQDVRLVESFVANRESDIWNDFVAIFHKTGGYGKAPTQFLYQQIPSYNVLVGDAGDPIKPIAETEDMLRGKRAYDELEGVRFALAEAQNHLEILSQKNEEASQRAAVCQIDFENIIARNNDEITDLVGQVEHFRNKLAETDAWIFRLAAERQTAEAEAVSIARAMAASEKVHNSNIERLKSAEDLLYVREVEHRDLAIQLGDTQARLAADAITLEWLRKVNALEMTVPRWWDFIPARFRRGFVLRRLANHGLFDADRYYELYPDVRADRMDALRHYILHGILERREI